MKQNMKQNCVQCGKEFILTPAQIELYRSKKLQLPKRCRECRMKNREKTGKVNGVRDYSNSSVALEEISDTPFNKTKPTTFIAMLIALVVVTVGSIGGIKGYEYYLDNYVVGVDNNQAYLEDQPGGSGQNNNNLISGITEMEEWGEPEADDTIAIAETESGTDEIAGTDGTDENDSAQVTAPAKPKSQRDNLKEVMIEKETTTEDPFAEDKAAEAAKAKIHTFKTKALKQEHYEKHGIDMGFDSADAYEQAASAVVNNPAALHKLEAEDGDDVYYIEATNEFVIVSRRGYIRTYFLPDAGKAYYDRQ